MSDAFLDAAGEVVRVFDGHEPFTGPDGTQHPATAWTQWGDEEWCEKIAPWRRVPVDDGPVPDARFYLPSDPVVTVTGEAVSRSWPAMPRPLAEVQQASISAAKEEANAILRATDWMVVRAVEDPAKPVPAEVESYRAAVRKASNDYEAAVRACGTIDALAAVPDPTWPAGA